MQARSRVLVVGGGLAGCEACYQLLRLGIEVLLVDMKPKKFSPAHKEAYLAELVCSNSLRSEEITTGVGLLKEEMRQLDSLIMQAAEFSRVPAGKALAVDREKFATYITAKLNQNALFKQECYELTSLEDSKIQDFDFTILAPGPLVSEPLARALQQIDADSLYFYDAIAPIVSADSINWDKVFLGSRYRPEDKDYLNIPLTEEEYFAFVEALLTAKKVEPKEFEKEIHFEGCLPIEEMARRGPLTLAYGPLKPVGLIDPRTGKQPFAVVQLRAENLEKTAFNLVGFQTKLTYSEQKRVFRMLPGLEQAEFLRLGSIHRNTFVNSPKILNKDLSLKEYPQVFLAGQITGVEGYVESAACGLLAGLIVGAKLRKKEISLPPPETALGALLSHLHKPEKNFQPSNIHFGLFPGLGKKIRKKERKLAYAQRAQEYFSNWLKSLSSLLK